jgi:hypothetical protein
MSRKSKVSESEQQKEDWMNSKWRPMMGWMYMVVCCFDFVLAPILWSLLQSFSQGSVQTQWQPLTLQGAGLFHIAMGAVLGIAAYGRTQEKLGGANNGGIQLPSNAGTTYIPPSSNTNTNINLGNQAPAQNNFGSGYGTVSPGFGAVPLQAGVNTGYHTAPVTTGWGGKKAPPEPDFPEI